MSRHGEEEKAMWLEDWKGSGKSPWVYAKENGLNGQTFNNWVKGMKQEAAQPFVEMSRVLVEVPREGPEILIEKGNIKIHIPLVINRNELREVLESLGGEE
jgi:hypothetical protein